MFGADYVPISRLWKSWLLHLSLKISEVWTLPLFVTVKKKNTFFFLKGQGSRRKEEGSWKRGYTFLTVVKEAGVGRNNTRKHHWCLEQGLLSDYRRFRPSGDLCVCVLARQESRYTRCQGNARRTCVRMLSWRRMLTTPNGFLSRGHDKNPIGHELCIDI